MHDVSEDERELPENSLSWSRAPKRLGVEAPYGKRKAQSSSRSGYPQTSIARRFYITVQDLHAIKVLRAPPTRPERQSE